LCDTIRRDVLADEVIRSTAFLVDEDDSDSVTSTAAPLARSEDEVDGEGDNHRDYEASSVFKPPTVNPVEEVVEEGLYDEEDRDYESSPVSREIPMIKDDEEPLPSRKAEPVEVEELPNIPIFRDLNSSEFFRNKKP
jgi:hypothetical protein